MENFLKESSKFAIRVMANGIGAAAVACVGLYCGIGAAVIVGAGWFALMIRLNDKLDS